MSGLVNSRQRILDSIRAATEGVSSNAEGRAAAYAGLPRAYTRQGKLRAKARIKLMIERLREYDAEVVECTPAELPAAIEARLKGIVAEFRAALPRVGERATVPFNRMAEWGEDGRIVPGAPVHSPFVRRTKRLALE